MIVLLDTSACIFFAVKSDRLSADAYALIEHGDADVRVSPVSCVELACLQKRKRIQLKEHWRAWFRRQLDENGWRCSPIALEVFEEAWSLPEPIHRDPADRILIATARLEQMTLVTTDGLILNYPHVHSLA